MSDDTGEVRVDSPRMRPKFPQSVELEGPPDRPVQIELEIDDERGARVRYAIDLTAPSADDMDRLASALLRGVMDLGQAYLAAAWPGSVQDDADLAHKWRRTLADRAGAL